MAETPTGLASIRGHGQTMDFADCALVDGRNGIVGRIGSQSVDDWIRRFSAP